MRSPFVSAYITRRVPDASADKGRCDYCHVEGDRASDEKKQKVTARYMILMVRNINASFANR